MKGKKVSIRLSEEDFNKLKELVNNGESLSAYYNGPQKLDHMLNYRCGLNIIKGVRSERKEKTAFSRF